MRLLLCFASSGLAAAICALGCNAITGADALVIDERESELSSSGGTPSGPDGEPADGATATTSSSSSSSGSTGNDASSSSSSGGTTDAGIDAPSTPPADTIIHQTFATAAACTGVLVTNGTTSYEPDGRDGAGACTVCATSAGETYLELSGTAATQGKATFEAYARRVPGAASPTSATIQFQIGGSRVTTSNNVGEAWVRLGGGSISVNSGATVYLRVGILDAAPGECLVVDDARVVVP